MDGKSFIGILQIENLWKYFINRNLYSVPIFKFFSEFSLTDFSHILDCQAHYKGQHIALQHEYLLQRMIFSNDPHGRHSVDRNAYKIPNLKFPSEFSLTDFSHIFGCQAHHKDKHIALQHDNL